MTRHTNSPIWCVALLLVACGGDASPEVQPTAAEPVEATASSSDLNELGGGEAQAEASAAQSAAVQSVVEPDAEVSSPDISGTHRSAVAPEPIVDSGQDAGELRVITGFDCPSAVLYDAQADLYLVSNLCGGEGSEGPGYIARVEPEGDVVAPRWIDGRAKRARLEAPRGMAIIRGRLYVTDGPVVRVYDRKTGVPRGAIKIPGATRLSGIARGASGSLLVSDVSYGEDGRPAGTDAVYRVNRAGRVSALFRSSVLGHPQGVLYSDKTVWIATHGSGKLYGLKGNGALISGPPLDEGRLVGLTEIGPNDVIVTSAVAQGIYRGSLDGSFAYLEGGITAPGHPAWDPKRRRLLVPSESTGEIRVLTIPRK